MLWIRFICGIFLITAQVYSADFPAFKAPSDGLLTSLDGEPSGLIDGHVNVISGGFVDSEVDMVIPGPEPLRVSRAWTQPASYEYRQKADRMEVYWLYENDSKVKFYSGDKATYGKNSYVAVHDDPTGPKLHFLFQKADSDKRNHTKMWEEMLSHGVTNTSASAISAQSNIRNSECSWKLKENACDIQLADGTQMHFVNLSAYTFYITKTVKPNFMQICKEVKKGIWKTILKNGNGLTLSSYDYLQIGKDLVHITASDGRLVEYEGKKLRLDNRERNKNNTPDEHHADFEELYQISRVKRPNAPEINYEYYEPRYHKNKKNIFKSVIVWPKVAKKSFPDSRAIEINYYTKDDVDITSSKFCKVKELRAPIGSGPEMLIKYRFRYHNSHQGKDGGVTGVIDAKGILTNYTFNCRFRLKEIVKCQANEVPYSIEKLYWGPKDTPQEIELQGRTFGSAQSHNKIFCKRNIYDDKGNIIEEQLWGNLTGKHGDSFAVKGGGHPVGGDCDLFAKKYSYSGKPYHLLTQTIEGRIQTDNVYLDGSNLLIASYKSDEKGIFERHFYHNDQNGLVVCHVVDDGKSRDLSDLSGVTVRKIERTTRSSTFPHGLPLVVSEYYLDHQDGQEKLLSEKRNTFDKLGRMTAQETYDCNRVFFAKETWEYDNHGNCLVHTNPMGDQIRSTYDANDNKITEQGPNPDLVKRFYYDYMNRLIKVEEQHPDVLLSKHFKYDLCGNQIASIDVFGNETTTEFDAFNRPIRIIAPPVQNAEEDWIRPVTQYTFDEMGHVTSVTDPEGYVTRFRHTLYGKPYLIQYPDGSEEHFEYDLQGNLVKEIAKNGTETHYILDAQSRVIKKQIFSNAGSLLVETHATYNSFRLLSETDAEGNITQYAYDAAGRKTSMQRGDQITRYEYDSIGRQFKAIQGNTAQISILDSINRKIEERVELANGVLLTASKFGYDADGNQTLHQVETPEGTATTLSVYDTHGVPKQKTDPMGYMVTCRQRFDHVGPSGYKSLCIESIDQRGQRTVSIQDALGRLVQEQKYDSFGTLLQETHHFYNSADKRIKTVHKVLLEGEEQRTVTNCFVHDSMGRLTLLIQAAGSPEERRFTTNYNLFGEKELFMKPDGVSLQYFYDALGRLSSFSSSDGSVHYTYTYDLLSRPIRVDDLIWNRTSSRNYDLYGNVIEEYLAHGLTVRMAYSPEGQIESLWLPDGSSIGYSYEGPRLKTVSRLDTLGTVQYSHNYDSYDSVGRLKSASLVNGVGQLEYKYNLNNAILSITGPNYHQENIYDSIGNLISSKTDEDERSFEYDGLNQLKKEEGPFSHIYSHDSLYNRASRDGKTHSVNSLNQILSDGEFFYTYDLSGNLISSADSTSTSKFSYDALDRLVSLQSDGKRYDFSYDENNRCLLIGDQKILYVGQNDIGTFSKEGLCINLRILGSGLGAEIGAAIAVEVQGLTYVPIHDHNGNVVRLLTHNGSVIEKYDFNAFGVEKVPENSINPWRFASKRNVSGYLLFGRRFYDPHLGRWLSPDPTGYDAGPNLYAYLSNNPLTHFDAYGLFEIETTRPSWHEAWGESARSIGSFAKSAVQQYGRTMQDFFWHAHPIPGIKDIGMAYGYMLENGTLSGYKPSWECDEAQYFKMEDRPLYNGNTILYYINGMNNTLEEAKIQQEAMSKRFGGCRVDLLYNPTRGTVRSVVDTLVDKCNIHSQTANLAISSLKNLVQEAQGIENGQVLGLGFSQGGQFLHTAVSALSAEERSYTHAFTLGSAKIIEDMGLKSYGNFISTADPIPFISNVNYTSARHGFVDGVTFIPSASDHFFDHTVFSPTYEKAIAEIHKKFTKGKR